MSDDYEEQRERNLYVDLPTLIRKIILDSTIPLPTNKEIVLEEIEQIKEITNAECKSTLDYLKETNIAFRD